jgi:hypothetical protein
VEVGVGDAVDRRGGAEPPARGRQHGLATDRGGRQEAGHRAIGCEEVANCPARWLLDPWRACSGRRARRSGHRRPTIDLDPRARSSTRTPPPRQVKARSSRVAAAIRPGCKWIGRVMGLVFFGQKNISISEYLGHDSGHGLGGPGPKSAPSANPWFLAEKPLDFIFYHRNRHNLVF